MKTTDPQSEKSPFRVLLGAALFLILGTAAVFAFYRAPGEGLKPSDFAIQNFAGKAEVFLHEKKSWLEPTRGGSLTPKDRIRTDADAEIDIILDDVRIRLKENSEMRFISPKIISGELTDRFELIKGKALVMTNKKSLQMIVPGKLQKMGISPLGDLPSQMLVTAFDSSFMLVADPKESRAELNVLQGEVETRAPLGMKTHTAKELETIEIKGLTEMKIGGTSYEKWGKLREAYDLKTRSSAEEIRQIDLSKEAGALFNNIFDHGTFYNERNGFAEREFFKDPETGEIHMEARYDVFPATSWVGLYFKTRELDLSQYDYLRFDARRAFSGGYPNRFLIELKDKNKIVRKFLVKFIRQKWDQVEFPLNFKTETPITEITMIFTHDLSGVHKKGSVLIKNLRVEKEEIVV